MNVLNNKDLQRPSNLKLDNSGFNLDYKKIFFEIIQYWWLFLITLTLSFGTVYVIHRYTKPTYIARMSMLIEVRGSEQPQNNMMEGFGLSSSMKQIDNQIAILTSYEMIKKAVTELDFTLTYFKAGRVKHTELYGNYAPFIVKYDSAAPQLINTPIFIHYIDKEHFTLSVDTELRNTYIYKYGIVGPSFNKIQHNEKYRFGEVVETPWLRIVVYNISLNNPDESGFYFEFYNPANLANQLKSKFRATTKDEKSSIVNLSITGYISQKNIIFLDKIAEVFIKNNLDKKNQIAVNAITFIEEQLSNISDSLAKTGSALSRFRTENQLQSVSEQARLLFSRLENLSNQISDQNLSKNYYLYLKSYFSSDTLFQSTIAPATFPVQNQIITEQIKNLIELNSERQLSLAEKNPFNIDLNNKMEIARQTLLSGIENQLFIINSEITRIRSLQVETSSELYFLPETERKLLGIERQFDLNNEVYTFLLRKRSEAQIQKASNMPDHSILESAKHAGQIHPTPSKDKQRALLIGLLLPILFVISKQFFNNKITSIEDIERITSLPIIGHVLHSNKVSGKIVEEFPKSLVAETFRRIRSRLDYLTLNIKCPIISISSSLPNEGKTFCAYNLASVFSIAGKKTILIGFDMRKPGLDKFSEFKKGTEGLSELLIGKKSLDEVIVSLNQENLFYIPAGTIPPNPSELIGSAKTSEIFENLKKKFDIIILDTPPMGVVSDGYLLARHVDTIVFLTRQNFTVREAFINSIKQMQSEGLRNIGILINDIQIKKNILGYGYGYSYGYGYGYGNANGYGYYEEE